MNISFPLEYDGDPNGVLLAPQGWLCRDLSDPGVFWTKTTGETTKTGWVAQPAGAIDAAITPVNSVAPVVSGTEKVGETLSVTTGTWNKAATYTYQWQRSVDGTTAWTNIGSATSTTYVIGAYSTQFIRCQVTAQNTLADSEVVNSNVTGAIAA